MEKRHHLGMFSGWQKAAAKSIVRWTAAACLTSNSIRELNSLNWAMLSIWYKARGQNQLTFQPPQRKLYAQFLTLTPNNKLTLPGESKNECN
jgi:hypothetical protein